MQWYGIMALIGIFMLTGKVEDLSFAYWSFGYPLL